MDKCIFCEIVDGNIPCYKIFEDENYLVFLDLYAKTNYQMLVIPKAHIEWVWDLPIGRDVSPNIGEYYEVVAKVARHVREVTGLPVRQMVYGFQVPHAHIQLRPGRNNDRDGSKVSEEELADWQDKLAIV